MFKIKVFTGIPFYFFELQNAQSPWGGGTLAISHWSNKYKHCITECPFRYNSLLHDLINIAWT